MKNTIDVRRSVASLVLAAIAVLAVTQLSSELHQDADVVLMQSVPRVSQPDKAQHGMELLASMGLVDGTSGTLNFEQLPNQLGKVKKDDEAHEESTDKKSHELSYGWNHVSQESLKKIMNNLNDPKKANVVASVIAQNLLKRKGVTGVKESDDEIVKIREAVKQRRHEVEEVPALCADAAACGSLQAEQQEKWASQHKALAAALEKPHVRSALTKAIQKEIAKAKAKTENGKELKDASARADLSKKLAKAITAQQSQIRKEAVHAAEAKKKEEAAAQRLKADRQKQAATKKKKKGAKNKGKVNVNKEAKADAATRKLDQKKLKQLKDQQNKLDKMKKQAEDAKAQQAKADAKAKQGAKQAEDDKKAEGKQPGLRGLMKGIPGLQPTEPEDRGPPPRDRPEKKDNEWEQLGHSPKPYALHADKMKQQAKQVDETEKKSEKEDPDLKEFMHEIPGIHLGGSHPKHRQHKDWAQLDHSSSSSSMALLQQLESPTLHPHMDGRAEAELDSAIQAARGVLREAWASHGEAPAVVTALLERPTEQRVEVSTVNAAAVSQFEKATHRRNALVATVAARVQQVKEASRHLASKLSHQERALHQAKVQTERLAAKADATRGKALREAYRRVYQRHTGAAKQRAVQLMEDLARAEADMQQLLQTQDIPLPQLG